MDKLELKHLAPYIPYGLKFHHFDDERSILSVCQLSQITIEEIVIINNMHEYAYEIGSHHVKPILRPMSDLGEAIFFNEELSSDLEYCDGFVTGDKNQLEYHYSDEDRGASEVYYFFGTNVHETNIPYDAAQVLLKHHFDIFGLIPAGLAIDINTVEGGSDAKA